MTTAFPACSSSGLHWTTRYCLPRASEMQARPGQQRRGPALRVSLIQGPFSQRINVVTSAANRWRAFIAPSGGPMKLHSVRQLRLLAVENVTSLSDHVGTEDGPLKIGLEHHFLTQQCRKLTTDNEHHCAFCTRSPRDVKQRSGANVPRQSVFRSGQFAPPIRSFRPR